MTGRVPWSEYSGEDIERAIAMFIAMEHPTAVRITPSRGDGGVGILDRGERTVVYQVKGFHPALTRSQLPREAQGRVRERRSFVGAGQGLPAVRRLSARGPLQASLRQRWSTVKVQVSGPPRGRRAGQRSLSPFSGVPAGSSAPRAMAT